MLPAKEFFGNSLEELRAYLGFVEHPKPKIERERLEGGCVLLSSAAWNKSTRKRRWS